MSATLARLRRRAAELEQKKQFDRALEVYVQILDEGGKDLGDEDVPLFNRVGDMLMRKGSVTEALGYYERAVDVYAERGYLNNAIALCSKILRQSPGRAAVYYKLARISAKKGFKSDARKNFLEYADRMQKLGMADEAFRALKEFASLYPDQDDVRLILAELLSKENRKGEALEQLQSLYEKLQSEGRAAEARATVDRMRAIDPSATPRAGSAAQATPAGDLIFLDLSEADEPNARQMDHSTPQPPSARAPMPTPVPALTGLSITFFPDEEATRPEGFESTSVEPEPADPPAVARPLTPAPPRPLTPAPPQPLTPAPSRPLTPAPPPVVDEPIPVDAEPAEEPAIAGTSELADSQLAAAEAAFDLVDLDEPLADPAGDGPDLDAEVEPEIERAAERQFERYATPLSGMEFGDLELEELPSTVAPRSHDLALPGELPATPDVVPAVAAPSPASAAAADDARTAAEEAADLVADIAAREVAQQTSASIPSTPATLLDEDAPAVSADEGMDLPTEFGAARSGTSADSIPDDFLSGPASFGVSPVSEEHAFPPLFGLAESAGSTEDESAPEPDMNPAEIASALEPVVPQRYVPTPMRGTISIGGAEGHLRRRLELDPENYGLQRQLGEALLDAGDRDGGLQELELAMAGFELRGDLDRAQEVVDEILGVFPGSVRHHQKRVEFAVRSRDKGRLTQSYLELADSLFRTGAGDKAVAVYARVLELDPGNERAEFALSTLAPEELVRLRGGPAHPERWTDELVAIEGDGPIRQAARAAETVDGTSVAAERPESPTPSESAAAQPELLTPDTPIDGIELPDPDWGEGVPARATASDAEESSETAETMEATSVVVEGEGDVVDDAAGLIAELPAATMETRDESSEIRAISIEMDVIGGYTSEFAAPREQEVGAEEEVRPREEPAPPAPSGAEASDPPGRDEGENEVAVDDFAAEATEATSAPPPRTPTPQSVASPPRAATPRSVATPPPVARVTPRPELQVGPDADFIDLGDWLRETEPARSTRMQVEDPKPTGDEQADFEEMLRRFKHGVAENVEAEDYDAHYDLGVAYKEMGLVDEAIAEFQKALRGPTNKVRSYEALGQCFVEKRQYPIAAALLKRATEVPGTDDQLLVGVLYLLGFATEHMGRPEEALPYYLRVFAVDIEFRDIAARVAAMGNLTK